MFSSGLSLKSLKYMSASSTAVKATPPTASAVAVNGAAGPEAAIVGTAQAKNAFAAFGPTFLPITLAALFAAFVLFFDTNLNCRIVLSFAALMAGVVGFGINFKAACSKNNTLSSLSIT